jgi:hypothetical protein
VGDGTKEEEGAVGLANGGSWGRPVPR